VDTNVSEEHAAYIFKAKTRSCQHLTSSHGFLEKKNYNKNKKSVHISHLPTHIANPIPFCLSSFDHVSHLCKTTGKL
jgi:hypothetical protein